MIAFTFVQRNSIVLVKIQRIQQKLVVLYTYWNINGILAYIIFVLTFLKFF